MTDMKSLGEKYALERKQAKERITADYHGQAGRRPSGALMLLRAVKETPVLVKQIPYAFRSVTEGYNIHTKKMGRAAYVEIGIPTTALGLIGIRTVETAQKWSATPTSVSYGPWVGLSPDQPVTYQGNVYEWVPTQSNPYQMLVNGKPETIQQSGLITYNFSGPSYLQPLSAPTKLSEVPGYLLHTMQQQTQMLLNLFNLRSGSGSEVGALFYFQPTNQLVIGGAQFTAKTEWIPGKEHLGIAMMLVSAGAATAASLNVWRLRRKEKQAAQA